MNRQLHFQRQEAQKRREHQLGHEFGRNSKPSFGELQQISTNATLGNRLRMVLGNYDEAQETMNLFGLKQVVGTETVPTTPGAVDMKHGGVFSSKSMLATNSEHSRLHSGGSSKEKPASSKLIISSSSKPLSSSQAVSSSHQRPQHSSQRPAKPSVSPKVTTHLTATSSSDCAIAKQSSPVHSTKLARPAATVPRPPSRHDNRLKEKYEKERTSHHHQHMSKDKRSDKEKLKSHQPHDAERGHVPHQKVPKTLHKPAAGKASYSLSGEDVQVKHLESSNLNKTLGSGRPVVASLPPSKSPHSRIIMKDYVMSTATAKPLTSKVPLPLPSPTARTTSTSEQDTQWCPTVEKPEKGAVCTLLENVITSDKKREKKAKKKKHKLKTSKSPRETERPPTTVQYAAELPSVHQLPSQVPSMKPVAQKPTSLDLSNTSSIAKPNKVSSPFISPSEDSLQDTYLQRILDEMTGPTSPVLPTIQTPYKSNYFSFAFSISAKAGANSSVVCPPAPTEAALISQQEVKQESVDEWKVGSSYQETDLMKLSSVTRNPFMDSMHEEMVLGMSPANGDGGKRDRCSSSSGSSSSGDTDSEDELLSSGKSDFLGVDSIEDICFDEPIDTITPLRSNPASFSYIAEPNSHAQLEPPTVENPMSQFVLAPKLIVQPSINTNNVDSESNSSDSEESSSDEDSSDSDVEKLFPNLCAPSIEQMGTTAPIVDLPSQFMSTEAAGISSNIINSVPAPVQTVVSKPHTSMKRLRNMFAAVKAPEVVSNTNSTAVQPLYTEAVTPVTPVSTVITCTDDNKNTATMQISEQSPQTAATITGSVTKDTAPVISPLPRKGNTKYIVSKHTSKSVLSEDSSSDSDESGEVTNSDSEDGLSKPRPSKLAKWDVNATATVTPETNELQLLCSIPRQYMERSLPTPVSTPKSPPTARIRPIMVAAPEKKFRDRTDSTSEDYSSRAGGTFSQQSRDPLYPHRRSRSREDSREPDYPPRSRDHQRPHSRRHSRSMRSSSPDHHHHHSSGSRHREPPPQRMGSHWSHGWSGNDHHYPYDYDYSSSHHSRRNRHTARLAKPELYMEEARKLKHDGDRMSSDVEKAQLYLEAALTYMLYCVSKEDEGDKTKNVMLSTVSLLKHILQSGGLNILARDAYCEMLSVLCLRSQSVLSMKVFNTITNSEPISRNQKSLSEYFTAKNVSQGRSPFVATSSPRYSPANIGMSGAGCSSGSQDYNLSCHSPSATVSVPSHIFNLAAAHLSVTGHLFHSLDSWRQADSISEQYREFFDTVDRRAGSISQYSSMFGVVEWAREGLRLLKSSKGRDY